MRHYARMSDPQQSTSPRTVNQAAIELGIPARGVRDLIARYELRAYDVSQRPDSGKPRWRITPEAIADFKDKRENRPTDQPPRRRAVRRASNQYV